MRPVFVLCEQGSCPESAFFQFPHDFKDKLHHAYLENPKF